MSFKDIFKKSFLEGYASTEITTMTIVAALAVACVLALYIFFVYRVVTRKTFYSKSFNITLAGITVITASLILTMQSSVVLSLGMVGALSIIRFRTAIKDSRDATYIFWAIGIGICCGVSDYITATVGSAFIFVVLVLFGSVRDNERILLILHTDGKNQEQLNNLIRLMFAGKAKLRVYQSTGGNAEVIYEISDRMLKRAEAKGGSIAPRLEKLEGVSSISIMRQEEEVNQ